MKYKTIEEAYNKAFTRLVSIARSHLHNTDHAIDCVHNVFVQRLNYKQRTGKEILSDYYLVRDVTRQAQKIDAQFFREGAVQYSDDLQNDGRRISGRVFPVINPCEATFNQP